MSLDSLRTQYPWPADKPDVPPDPHGWCQPEHRSMLAKRVGPDTRVVVELGSWLGQSTRLLLELAPAATVICVDHWQGSTDMQGNASAEARLATAYETFLVNQWPWRERVVPLRSDSCLGLRTIHDSGVTPDLIYFDSEHTTEHLTRELETARRLFPRARLYGDDWAWESVRRAVEDFALVHDSPVSAWGNAWALDSLGGV